MLLAAPDVWAVWYVSDRIISSEYILTTEAQADAEFIHGGSTELHLQP